VRSLMRSGILVALAAVLLGGCASYVESSWRAPTTTPESFRFRNILVVVLAKDGVTRRAAEDELVRAVASGPRGKRGEVRAAPSYSVLDDADLGDVEKTRAKVDAKGFDGAILVGFLSAQQRIPVDPPMGTPMWGYYGRRGMVYDAGSVRSDTIVRIQTNVYAVGEGKLIWSGVSKTMNPSDVRNLAADVVHDVGGALREEGLIE
jgi:hypothetical protein